MNNNLNQTNLEKNIVENLNLNLDATLVFHKNKKTLTYHLINRNILRYNNPEFFVNGVEKESFVEGFNKNDEFYSISNFLI